MNQIPLSMNRLRRLLAVNNDTSYTQQRDRSILALKLGGLTPGQIAGLTWPAVELQYRSAVLEVRKPTRSQGTITEELDASKDVGVCPVEALRDLRDVATGDGAVFTHNGKTMTSQDISKLIKRLTAGMLRDETATTAATFTLLQRRDRALLLAGWYAAMPPENLRRLNWGDMSHENGEWELVQRDGNSNWLSLCPDPEWPCAASAMSAWYKALTQELGADPMRVARNQPVFPEIDHEGNIRRTSRGEMMRLDDLDLNEVVQTLCKRAGFDPNRYDASSLRSGFITEALTDDRLSILDVQEVTHHESTDELYAIHRRVNDPQRNLTKKLWRSSPST
jgi:hypothetical protein